MAPHTTPQSSQASSFGGTLYQAALTQAEPFVQMAIYTSGSFGTTLNDVAEEASALSYGGSFQEGFSPGAHQDKASREAKTVTSKEKDNFVRLVGYAGSPYDTAGWSTKQKQDAAVEASLIIAGMAGIVVAPVAAEIAGITIVNSTPIEVSKYVITKSSLKRLKRLINALSNNSRQNFGLSQSKVDQLRRIINKAGGSLRNDGISGVKGSSAGKPHVQTEGLGKSIDSRHIWTQPGVR